MGSRQIKTGYPPLVPLIRESLAFARWLALKAVLLMVTVSALEATGLLFLAPMLQLIGVGAGRPAALPFAAADFKPSLSEALFAYLLLVVFHSVISWRRDISSDRLQQNFVDHLRQQLFDGIGSAEWEFLARTHSAEFSHTLITDLARINIAINALLQIMTTAVVAAAYVVLAMHLSMPLTAITLGAGALMLLLLRHHHRVSHRLGQGLTQSTQRLHSEVSEYLSGLKLAKSANAEARLSRRFATRMQDARNYVLAFTQRQGAARSLLRVGAALALALLVYTALAILALPATTVLVLVFIFARLFPFLLTLQQSYERLIHTLPAYSAFTSIRAQCRASAEPPGEGKSYTLRDAIRLEGICYRPANVESDIVNGMSVTIRWRSTTALIGPSGAGKTTSADLIAGLLEPSSGHVTVDGRILDDRRAWRESVAYVTQDTFLFDASVRENLLWATPDATDAEIWNALEQSAAGFLRALPQGLDTVVGERGIRLSGGERQRLAIARALLRKPQVLILDEATSSLDRDNEQRIQSALANLHGYLTIIVIAHRLATVQGADQIVVMQHGRVIETGTYNALVSDASSYLSRAGSFQESKRCTKTVHF